MSPRIQRHKPPNTIESGSVSVTQCQNCIWSCPLCCLCWCLGLLGLVSHIGNPGLHFPFSGESSVFWYLKGRPPVTIKMIWNNVLMERVGETAFVMDLYGFLHGNLTWSQSENRWNHPTFSFFSYISHPLLAYMCSSSCTAHRRCPVDLSSQSLVSMGPQWFLDVAQDSLWTFCTFEIEVCSLLVLLFQAHQICQNFINNFYLWIFMNILTDLSLSLILLQPIFSFLNGLVWFVCECFRRRASLPQWPKFFF